MRRRLTALLAGLTLMFAAASAFAVPIPIASFTIGGITFSDFTATLNNQGVSAPFDASGITVTPEILGGNAGFQISGGFFAASLLNTPVSTVDLVLHYTAVSAAPIHNVELSFDGQVLNSPAFASVTEIVYSNATLQNILGTVVVTTPSPLSQEIILSQDVNTVYVTKDIVLASIPTNGLVTVSDINQTLSTAPVPEPASMMLLGAGFLGLAIYGKRRRNA